MKTFLILLTAIVTLGSATVSTHAKEYVVKNIGKTGLKNSCARGGGTFTDGENSYACTYENGNIRECSKRTGDCIVVTPPKRQQGGGDNLGGLSNAGVGLFN